MVRSIQPIYHRREVSLNARVAVIRRGSCLVWQHAALTVVRYGSEADIGRVAANVSFGPEADVDD